LALDAADRCLNRGPSLEWDFALSRLSRALTLSDLADFDKAQEVLRRPEEIFQRHGDLRRQAQCLLTRGIMEWRQSKLEDARATFRRAISVYESIPGGGDLHGLASAYHNLCGVATALGSHPEAAGAIHMASSLFSELGLTTEIARAKGLLGGLQLAMGRYADARDGLTEARELFLSLELVEEAGLAGLELAEAHIALREEFRARVLIQEVLGDFARSGLYSRVATAMRYADEMCGHSRGRVAVRHVRKYVERLREAPLLLFAPLPDDAND
jgi:tetratricopeptide (TPR) repeat protein